MPHVIEIALQDASLNEEQLLCALQEHLEKLEVLTLRDRLEFRATIDDGTFELESVEQVPPQSVPFSKKAFSLYLCEPVVSSTDQYILAYSFEWSAYRGCSDADDAGRTNSYARFTYRNGIVRFEFEQYFENDSE